MKVQWFIALTLGTLHVHGIFSDSSDELSQGVKTIHIGVKQTTSSLSNLFMSKKCSESDVTNFLREKQTPIAKGADGAVFKWERKRDGKLLAVKQLLGESKEARQEFKTEAELLFRFKGSGITTEIECTFRNNGELFYMMEFLEGTGLDEAKYYYHPLKEDLNVKWTDIAVKMATALQRVHKKGVVHLDLHLKNWILTPQGRLYLIDFSRARKTSFLRNSKSYCQAPETKENPSAYSPKSDVWILGHMLRFMYQDMVQYVDDLRGNGHTPHEPQLLNIVRKLDTTTPNKIISLATKENPDTRLSINDLISELEEFGKFLKGL
jgi:serine/threonine protein kinase